MSKALKSDLLNEIMYVKTLPSGLSSYIIPKKGFNEKFAGLAVNFGSCDLEFEAGGKRITSPDGVAHFLEHKAFEDEKLDYFNEFTKLSGSVNAYTNFNTTVYYFSCTENFTDCLKLLFDMVYSLYITDETIEKEKGIIEQEISMYDDDPGWRVYFNMLEGLYEKSPVRNEIAGTAESIAKIDKPLLEDIFKAFYVPGNMALVCSGDFDMDEVYAIANEKTAEIKSNPVSKLYPAEPLKALKSRVSDKMHVAKPLFCLGFKDVRSMDKLHQMVSMRILLDMIMGASSETFNRLYLSGLIDSGFGMDYSHGSCYATTMFSGASKDIDAVVGEIMAAIKNIKKTGIDRPTFERLKRKHLGRFMQNFNSVSTPSEIQADLFVKGINIFELAEALKNVTEQNVAECIEGCFSEDNYCLSLIEELK